jgi:hypothetical protein
LKERNQLALKFVATHLALLPLLLICSFLPITAGILALPIAQTVLLITFFAGYWEFTGMRFRWICCSVIEILLIGIGISQTVSGVKSIPSLPALFIFALISLYLWYTLVKIIWVIFRGDREKLEIEFPFQQGSYLITDGGNSRISRLMNYHFHSVVHKKRGTNQSMLYATDVVKLTDGKIKFLPIQNEDYPIFSEKVYSPMEGVIFKVVNDIYDNLPFSGNYPYNTGNTVVIKKDQYYFLLGHLKKGSIVVQEGDSVRRNAFIGEAGNSGMSERPHLHMQLMKSETNDYWKGTGICIQYKAKNLYKNRLIKTDSLSPSSVS